MTFLYWGAAIAMTLMVGTVLYMFWVTFRPDLKACIDALRAKKGPTRLPDNVVPFMAPELRAWLETRPKRIRMNTPAPKLEKRR